MLFDLQRKRPKNTLFNLSVDTPDSNGFPLLQLLSVFFDKPLPSLIDELHRVFRVSRRLRVSASVLFSQAKSRETLLLTHDW